MDLVDLPHCIGHRARVLRALDLGQRGLALEAAERGAGVADDVPDHAADEGADEHRREPERLGDRPPGAEGRQRGGAEDRAQDDSPGYTAGEDRIRLAVSALGEALDHAWIELRKIMRRHDSRNRLRPFLS